MKWFMKLTVEELRYLPEYCLKDLLDFYMYGFRFNPHINTRFIDFDQFFDFLVYSRCSAGPDAARYWIARRKARKGSFVTTSVAMSKNCGCDT